MTKLGDICKLIADGDWIESKDQANDGIRLIQTGNIGIGKFLNKSSKSKYISSETFNRLKCTEVFAGDILISRLPDPVGRACMVPANIGKAITAVDCTIIRLNDSCISNYFLNYTQSDRYYNELQTFLAGTTRTRISRKNLEKIEIPLPSLDEQRRIAATLDKVTDLISKRRQQLDKLDELVKSRFVEMFGDPAYSPKWPTKKLSQLGELNRGVSKHRPRNDPALLDGPYPLIQTGDVTNSGLYILTYSSSYSELGLAQSRLWKAGTLCITIAANIAQTSILTFDACFPDSVVGFIPGNQTNAIFIHYWFSFFQKILEEQAPQVAQKNINLKILSDLDVIVPPNDLQMQFSQFVQRTDKTKTAISRSLEKLETLKKALMQEYFNH